MWICIHYFKCYKSVCVCRCTVISGMVQMKFSATNENDSRKHLIPYVHKKQSNSFHTSFLIYFFLFKNSFIYVNICPKHSTQSLSVLQHSHIMPHHHVTHPSKKQKKPLFLAELSRSEPAFYTIQTFTLQYASNDLAH